MTVIYVGAQRKDGESVRIGCEIFKDLQNLRVEFITSTSSFYDAKLKSIGYLLEHLEPNDSLTIQRDQRIIRLRRMKKMNRARQPKRITSKKICPLFRPKPRAK